MESELFTNLTVLWHVSGFLLQETKHSENAKKETLRKASIFICFFMVAKIAIVWHQIAFS
jgi:hypothetical protein